MAYRSPIHVPISVAFMRNIVDHTRLFRVIVLTLVLVVPCLGEMFDQLILERELQKAERVAQGTLQKADALFEMGFRDRAWLLFRELKIADIPPEERARYFFLRGRIEWDLKRPKLALKNFRQVERESTGSAFCTRLYSTWVRFALTQDDKSDAELYRNKLNELPEAEQAAALATARILADRGENQAALSILRGLTIGGGTQGAHIWAQHVTLELALLLDKLNQGPEAWRIAAEVLRNNLQAKREWLAAESFETLSKIRKIDKRITHQDLEAEIQESMPKTRLGLQSRYWSVWGRNQQERQRWCEQAFDLAVELDEPHIAALFAVKRADFAEQQLDSERWNDRALELASSRPVYEGSSWFWWIHPGRLELARLGRKQGSRTQQFMDRADLENDLSRRLYQRSQAYQHSVLESDASRSLRILPLIFQELTEASRVDRLAVARDLFWVPRAGMHWSATARSLNIGNHRETPVSSLTRRWLKSNPKKLQALLDAFLGDVNEAKSQGDRRETARAQQCLSALLTLAGREEEALLLARESMKAYEAVGSPMAAAEVLLTFLGVSQSVEQSALVAELISRYRGQEDYSVVGGLWISHYFQKIGQPGQAEEYVQRYLAAPSGRTKDSRRVYFFRELAALQRQRRDFQGSFDSLNASLEYKNDQVLVMEQARTHLEAGSPRKALELLSFEYDGIPAGEIHKLRLKSQALWALGKSDEAHQNDRDIKEKLGEFLSRWYHPELRLEILGQPLFTETLKELRQRNPEFSLTLPSPPPLVMTSQDSESIAEAMERLRRRSALARKNLKLNIAQIEELQSQMGDDEAVVHLFPMEESLGILVVQKQGANLREYVLGSKWRTKLAELKKLIANPQSSVEFYERRAAELGELLVAPWLGEPKSSNLHLLTSGELRGFPLEVLGFGSAEALRSKSTAYYDSDRPTSVWLGLPKSGAFIDGSQGLAGAKRELRELSQLMPEFELRTFSGKKSEFKTSDGLIHICSHGLPPDSQALLGRLLAGENELKGSIISQLSLRPDQLVVLSSCSGGVDPYSRDNTLAHLFRAAGAGRVIASSWSLDDKVAPFLFKEFYRELQQGRRPGVALNRARQAVATRFPHPYYWGGVVLYQNISRTK